MRRLEPRSRFEISYYNQGVPLAGKLDGTAGNLVLVIQLVLDYGSEIFYLFISLFFLILNQVQNGING